MMMRRRAWHGVMVVGTMLLTACSGPSGEQRATRDLNGRLEARLAPEIALGRASVQPLPDGARVTLMAPGPDGRWGIGQDSRVSMVQAMLDPSLLRIELASEAPPDEAMAHAVSVMDWDSFARTDPSAAPPGGMVMTVHVVCPHPEPIDGRPGCR